MSVLARKLDLAMAPPALETQATFNKPLVRVKDFHAIERYCDYFNQKAQEQGRTCGYVLKSDAYGFGAAEVAELLHRKDARLFFTSDIWEAIAIREAVPDRDARIFTMHGFEAVDAEAYSTHDISPVLNSPAEAAAYGDACARQGRRGVAALQIDTGMNRSGFGKNELAEFARNHERLTRDIDLQFYVTHLHSVDLSSDSRQEKSLAQIDHLRECLRDLPPLPVSITATHGTTFIDYNPAFSITQDIQRVGVGVMGDLPDNPIAFQMYARINRVRDVPAGQTIGYDGIYTAPRDMKVAVLEVGYGDGYPRHLSASEKTAAPACVDIDGHRAPVVGKIAMNLMCVDVTDMPPAALARARYAELVGNHIDVRELADKAALTPEDILISLNRNNVRAQTLKI